MHKLMGNDKKKHQTYILLVLVAIMSCKNVEQEKLKTALLSDNTLAEPQNASKPAIESSELKANSDDSENLQEQLAIKENKNKLRIGFTKIDSTDYFDYKSKYANGVTIDSTIIHKAGSYFALSVNNTEQKFSCDIDYNNCHYYLGFLAPLNKYIVSFYGNGYSETFLIDKETGHRNILLSPFDTACEAAILSKDQDKLIAFVSSVFDGGAFISLYKKNTDTKKINFNEFDSFYSSEWRIKEITWVDENTIALKVFDNYGEKSGSELINTRYLKGKIE